MQEGQESAGQPVDVSVGVPGAATQREPVMGGSGLDLSELNTWFSEQNAPTAEKLLRTCKIFMVSLLILLLGWPKTPLGLLNKPSNKGYSVLEAVTPQIASAPVWEKWGRLQGVQKRIFKQARRSFVSGRKKQN